MTRQKRCFYIIGHNPNTIEEAMGFLDKGANALEPDIVHADGRFYISHTVETSYENTPTLEEYLQSLKTLLLSQQYNLALIIWDLKETDFDPNRFIEIVKENFSGGPCDGVTMLMTHSDDHAFINRYKGSYENVGVGVDESDIAPSELEKIFETGGQKNFSYADGITTILQKPEVFKNVREAVLRRSQYAPGSFKIIYTWVLKREAAIRKYLDTNIDGIMVDVGTVNLLKELICKAPYNEVFRLAQNGYNPFTAAPIATYLLTVKTKDKFLAGTDARFLFTLTGSSGLTLKSLPFDANIDGALEKGSSTYITMEGIDVGVIESLTIEALTDSIGAGWLPEKISVESKQLPGKLEFDFNSSDADEWITKKRGAVIKFPSR